MQDSIQIKPTHIEIDPPATEHPSAGVTGVEETATVESAVVTQPEQRETTVKKTTVSTRQPAVKAVHGVPKYLSWPYVGSETSDAREAADAGVATAAGSAVADSLATDSLTVDTVVPGEAREGIVLVNPAAAYRDATPVESPGIWGGGMSWIYLGLAIMFCIIGVRFKGNKRYLKAVLSDLTDTRVRHNAFDDTVKETSLLVLLNILWVACAGILLWVLVRLTVPDNPEWSLSIPDRPAQGIGLCIGVAAVYALGMFLAYWTVGNVFSDRKLTRLWLKGAAAASGLETFMLFPLSLVALSYPGWAATSLIIAGVVFVIGKIVFLYKGFRIFFSEISSWMLFLYYLCSLEIVPLILTYVATVAICTTWL